MPVYRGQKPANTRARMSLDSSTSKPKHRRRNLAMMSEPIVSDSIATGPGSPAGSNEQVLGSPCSAGNRTEVVAYDEVTPVCSRQHSRYRRSLSATSDVIVSRNQPPTVAGPGNLTASEVDALPKRHRCHRTLLPANNVSDPSATAGAGTVPGNQTDSGGQATVFEGTSRKKRGRLRTLSLEKDILVLSDTTGTAVATESQLPYSGNSAAVLSKKRGRRRTLSPKKDISDLTVTDGAASNQPAFSGSGATASEVALPKKRGGRHRTLSPKPNISEQSASATRVMVNFESDMLAPQIPSPRKPGHHTRRALSVDTSVAESATVSAFTVVDSGLITSSGDAPSSEITSPKTRGRRPRQALSVVTNATESAATIMFTVLDNRPITATSDASGSEVTSSRRKHGRQSRRALSVDASATELPSASTVTDEPTEPANKVSSSKLASLKRRGRCLSRQALSVATVSADSTGALQGSDGPTSAGGDVSAVTLPPKKRGRLFRGMLTSEDATATESDELGTDDVENDAMMSGDNAEFAKSSSDFDEDLPSFSWVNSSFSVGDLIWVKFKKYPFWPALVRYNFC